MPDATPAPFSRPWPSPPPSPWKKKGLRKFRAMDIHRRVRSEMEEGENGTPTGMHQAIEK
ncbi:hypothetical protein [Acidovorax sp.]|uniref:hypothetical protein n=1 Tax=Acidovorax sp. TaxID=1872122 RepID=UPI00391F664B